METERVENSLTKDEESGSPSDPNEHDYAHTTATNFVSTEGSSSSTVDGGVVAQESFIAPAEPEQIVPGQPTLSVELPEPAVGAEVDCPGGPSQIEEDPQKTATSAIVLASGGWRGVRRRALRPEDKNCSCCKTQFERHGRSFNRRAVYTFTTPETVQWAFPDVTVHEKSFLCESCAQFIRSKCKRKQSGKRSLWLKPPVQKQVCRRSCVTI